LDIYEKIVITLGSPLGSLGVSLGISAVMTEAGVVGATAAGVVSAAALPITLGVAGIGLIGFTLYKMSKCFKSLVLSSISE
jgi:hypothetical protein